MLGSLLNADGGEVATVRSPEGVPGAMDEFEVSGGVSGGGEEEMGVDG